MSNGIIAATVLLLLVVYFVWFLRHSRLMLQRWATQNGFEIIHFELRWLFQGPFTGWSNKGQTVYRVKVRDRHGHERLGWILCGGIWSGLFSNQVRVEWDDANKSEIKEGNQLAVFTLIACIIIAIATIFISGEIIKRTLTAGCLIFALICIWRLNR
jgi:hypothetical protein